ncbi:MAG TPA: DNA translocase FtsK 4TM domain-containing protein [Actinomycetes bacterium]|nr:DNA translocase FtsK 4TM domain-containing protein [Actinomycetes bacterium]
MAKARTGPKSRGTRPSSGRSGGRTAGRAPKAAAGTKRRQGDPLAPHRRDIQGTLLLLFALLTALAVWWHVHGAAMEWADVLLRGLFGLGAYAVPVLAAALGVIVLRNRDPADEPVAGRVVIGGLAILLGGLGLLHLLRGRPDIHAGTASLQGSGGAVGALSAEPLARFLSPWGAGAIFGCLLFLGLLITTKTPVSSVTRALGTGARWTAGLFSQVQTDLAGRRQSRELEPVAEPELVGLDELVPPEDARGAARRRRARPAAADDEAPPEGVTVERPRPEPAPVPSAAAPAPPAAAAPAPPEPGGPYALPPTELLRAGQARPVDERRLDETAAVLENTLDQFEVDARVARYTRGPTVTRYEVELGPATKVARVIGLSHDIAYALASPDVRIIAPIPGKSAIGIEVPNRDRELVTLGDILHSPAGQAAAHPLTVALGKDIGGEPVLANLADMPHVLIAGSTGAGKALALDTPVPTPSGWTTMGELRDGDTVFGADGQPCQVLKAHDVLLDEPCYEVEFDDGSRVVASEDHLWLTWDLAARKAFDYHCGGTSRGFPKNWATWESATESTKTYSSQERALIAAGRAAGRTAAQVADQLGRSANAIDQQWRRDQRAAQARQVGPRVVNTGEIARSLRVRGQRNHTIPTAGALDLPERELPLDPWVLGYLLGDGDSSGSGRVACDPQDRAWLMERFIEAGVAVTPYADQGHFFADVRQPWRLLGLGAGKHVPEVYLWASAEQRRALAQGMVDSDGSIDGHGCYRFANTNRQLVEGFAFLCASVGYVTRVYERRRERRGVVSQVSWEVVVAAHEPLARLPRKVAKARHVWKREQNCRYIVDVRPVRTRPVRCITVDSPDHLYLASRACIPTHNSVSLNVLVTSLLMRNTPDRVRLILIDPKRVELTNYEGVPHLITPVVTHPKRAAEALAWAVREMELRLETLAVAGVRNLAAYNQAAEEGKLPPLPSAELDEEGRPAGDAKRPKLPFIVLVIDELADLMMVAPRDVEDAICRIAQMARAVGIHLVVATQRPSVDVVTGLIKANIPSRIAFMVASAQDSRVILDTGGADKLVGHGDMLFLPGGTSKPLRVQGAYITEKEVEEVVAFCKAQQGAHYQPGVVAEGRATQAEEDSDEDPLLDQAMDIIVRSGLGSTSMLQSKMKVGFSRARRIMDQLEERGVVGPSEGSKPRDVLMTVEELGELRERESSYGELAGG